MVAISIFLPLLAATSALASSPLADDDLKATRSTQQVISRPRPPISHATTQPIECPPDMACGGSSRSIMDSGDDGNVSAWCTNRVGARCGGERLLPNHASYAELRTIVGCESLPVNAPLCPVGECDGTCLCRESLLKRLEDLLFPGGKGKGEGFGKEEL